MRATRLASLVSFLLLALAGPVAARGGMPNPLTERGELIEDIYYKIFVVAVVVFLFVMALLVWVMVRYKASSGHGKATFEHERENLKLELTWIIIPLFIMLWIGFISYAGLVQLDEGYDNEDAFATIYVEGTQWNWEADYGNGVTRFADPDPNTGVVAEENAFLVPADVPIRFILTSGDVIHAWSMLDANYQQFALIDANPTGPHKENSMTMVIPEGDYAVQCKEMCFNPGHAYMRATVRAVPVDDYNAWLERATLLAPCALEQTSEFEATGSQDGGILVNSGCAVVDITNPGNSAITATVDASGAQTSTEIGPGETGLLVFEPEAGSHTISLSNGATIDFDVIEATAINIDLGDFFIAPVDIDLNAGETYLLRINNVGAAAHNLFVGEGVGKTVDFQSATIGGGESTTLLITPDVAMSFETWCNIPGHASAGMVGALTVA